MKNTHGTEEQFTFDFDGDGILDSTTDEECYYVKDIAKYIFEKYNSLGRVQLDVAYQDLDVHPIFPSDGFRNEIKKELGFLGVKITKGMVVFPSHTIQK
jgi:hypothetical protein